MIYQTPKRIGLKRIFLIPFLGILFLTATLVKYAGAETELKFENAVMFGDSGDQLGSAVKVGEDRLYIAGAETSSSKSLSVSFALPLTNNPRASFLWKYEPTSSDLFNDIAITDEGLYFSGQSLPKTGTAAGTLVKFPLNQSGPAIASWAVKPQFFTGNTDGNLQAVLTDKESQSLM